MNITISYDASVNSAPAAFKTDVAAVVAYFESQYTDNISFNLHVGYGEIDGTTMPAGYLGQSYAFYDAFSYSQIKAALTADATTADDATAIATLPASDPDPSTHTWYLTEAQQKAIGLLPNATVIDAYVGFAKPANAVFDYDRSNGIATNQYDFIGTVAHELTEVMGRNLEDNTQFIGSNPSVTPLDLFHYSAASTRSFALGGYFSFDDGATNLDPFNFLNDGSDPGDWAPGAGNDSFLNESGFGVYNNISVTDLRLMDVIGYDSTGDDYGADTNFAGLVRVNNSLAGTIGSAGDHDWVRVRLIAGTHYSISVSGQDTGGGTNADPAMHVYDANSVLLISRDDSSSGLDPHLLFTPQTTGFYYVDIYSSVGDTGSYTLSVAQPVAAGPTDISVPENSTAVTTVNDNSDSASGPLIYSIDGGADAAFFQIDAASGALSFIVAPDFEKPADSDHNNSYVVQVNASDGAFFSDDQTIIATVANVNDAPLSDFFGDGHSGILWQNADGTPAIWSMDGTGLSFGSNAGFDPGPTWHAIGSGDFNADGKADILWQNDDGTPAIWLMDGATILSGANVGFNPGPAWHVIGAGDFNGDGKADILWQNADGTPAVWLMNGLNLLSGANVGFNPGAAWHVVGAGDFNGDGKADILWQNTNGQAAVWLMNGLNLVSGSNVGANPGIAWHVVGTGDFNGDGKADILWQNTDGTPAIWLMNGTSLISGSNIGFDPGPTWHVIGAGDYNGDGMADILWQNADGTPAVWLMNGTSLISGANAGFDPGTNWHAIPQHHDLLG
jgi:hypothetical protein